MFYIHGGGFMSWSGNDFDGKYFADENVIVVSINYRLGPLGIRITLYCKLLFCD